MMALLRTITNWYILFLATIFLAPSFLFSMDKQINLRSFSDKPHTLRPHHILQPRLFQESPSSNFSHPQPKSKPQTRVVGSFLKGHMRFFVIEDQQGIKQIFSTQELQELKKRQNKVKKTPKKAISTSFFSLFGPKVKTQPSGLPSIFDKPAPQKTPKAARNAGLTSFLTPKLPPINTRPPFYGQ